MLVHIPSHVPYRDLRLFSFFLNEFNEVLPALFVQRGKDEPYHASFYFGIYPKAEYADSDGNSATWGYYLTQAMQDEVNNPPSGESILYVPYTEGDFYGYDTFILDGLYGWGWFWFDAYAVGGQQYLEEGNWSYSYGGVTYTYSCTSVVESIGSYSFTAWEIDISWTEQGVTTEYKADFSPSLPLPIYLKAGTGNSYWEYQLTDLAL